MMTLQELNKLPLKEKLELLTEHCGWTITVSSLVMDAEPMVLGDDQNLFAIEKDINIGIQENYEVIKEALCQKNK